MSHLICNRFNLSIITVLLFAFPVLAASGTVDVTCVDQSGSPVSGIKVQIQHVLTGKWKDKKSDGKGLARFDKLDSGVYRVVARQAGYAPAIFEFVNLKDNAQESVSLTFKPGEVATPLYFESQTVSQRSIDALQEGIDLLRESKFAEAEKKLHDSLELNPSNPDSYFNLAIAYAQQIRWDDAEQALHRTIQLSDTMALLQKTRDPLGQNPYDEMRQRAEDLLSKLPALKLRVEATEAMSKKNFQKAIEMYRESLKEFPDDPETYYNLALALANNKEYDEAIQWIDKGIQSRPTEAAYKDLKKQIVDFKENAVLMRAQELLDQGEKLFQDKDYAGALKKYEEARPMIPGPKQAIALSLIAKAEAQLNNPDKAIEAYKRAIEIAPDEAEHRKALAQYYLNQKRYEEALNLYADPKAAGTEPVDKTLFELGEKLSREGNADVAALAFEKTLQANPKHAEAHYELGMHYFYNTKDTRRAKDLLTKYLELGQDKDRLNNTRSVLVVISRRASP